MDLVAPAVDRITRLNVRHRPVPRWVAILLIYAMFFVAGQLAYAALDAALDIWDDVDMADVRARSIELSELFLAEVEAYVDRYGRRADKWTIVAPSWTEDEPGVPKDARTGLVIKISRQCIRRTGVRRSAPPGYLPGDRGHDRLRTTRPTMKG